MIQVYSDEWFMREALKEAQKAFDLGEVPVGAVVVLNNKVIGRGHNQTEQLHDITAHAEMIAITAASNYIASKYLIECTLYVTLEPCVMCAGGMSWAQVGRIVIGASDARKGFSMYSPSIIHSKVEICKGVYAKESEEILKKFFTNLRNLN